MRQIEVYYANGYKTFYYSSGGINTETVSIDDIVKEACEYDNDGDSDNGFKDYVLDSVKSKLEYEIYDIMSGLEFLSHIKCGTIINSDGLLSEVFIDGYKSNLGLISKNFSQGEFLVDEETFMNICKTHKVEVNWANN